MDEFKILALVEISSHYLASQGKTFVDKSYHQNPSLNLKKKHISSRHHESEKDSLEN